MATNKAGKGVLNVEWPLFGELARALALRAARSYDPEIVVGIGTTGSVPAAVVAAMLSREFHSLLISRKLRATTARKKPAVLDAVPESVRGRRVLIVDETCGSGETLRLAMAAIVKAGASEVRTAVCFKTGEYEPDFHALATESQIILPWDREIMIDGELQRNPKYAALIE